MKFGKILAVAVVATVFASCSNEEELANVGKSESNAIRFAGISGLSDTRTTPIGTHNLTSTNFDVMAFMSSDNALFMGGKHVSGASDQLRLCTRHRRGIMTTRTRWHIGQLLEMLISML